MHRLFALALPIVLAALLAGFAPVRQQSKVVDMRLTLQRLEVESARELEAYFESVGYGWPLQADQQIPPLELRTLPKDLYKIDDVTQRKALFFRSLLPIVLAENEKLLELRAKIIELIGIGVANLDDGRRRWLESIAAFYKVRGNIRDSHVQRKLLRRVDVVPAALVLAQAANESAWGTSRFALQGNNLFGLWTYRQASGIVPQNRPEGASYAVRAFSSIDASVRAYLQNLNTNAAYTELRKLREDMRVTGEEFDSHRLAVGLLAYSSRGEEYVEEIQAMMRSNRLLSRLERVSLKSETRVVSDLVQAD
jgi:Bax protein